MPQSLRMFICRLAKTSHNFYASSVLPLLDPYKPLPAISESEYQALCDLSKSYGINKLAPEAREAFALGLEKSGFFNEAHWIRGRVPERVVPTVEVTVYVPCFNAAHLLDETLGAIKAQSYPVKEIIVVDDGSTDNSVEIAKKYTTHVISHPSNRGLAASRNTALQAVTTPLVAGIDADTVLDPYWVEKLIPALVDAKTAGAAGRLIERFGTTLADGWRKELMGQHHGRDKKENVHLFGCNSLIRTDLLRQLGGFNEQCKTSFDDIDISERILKAGFRTVYIPEAVCYHCKKDTPTSIVSSAYRWRIPPFELKGAFRDPKVLAARWITEITEGIKDINSLVSQGKGWLTFPCYMMVFYTIIADALRVARDPHHAISSAATAAVFKTIKDAPFFTQAFRDDVVTRLQGVIGACSHVVHESSSDDLFMKDVDAALSRLLVTLTDLPSVFRFSKDVSTAIEESRQFCVGDESVDIYGAKDRAALVVSKDSFEPLKSSLTSAAEEWDLKGTPYRIFFDSLASWDTRATLAELQTLKPKEVLWFAAKEELPCARSAGIIFSLMSPETDIQIRGTE